MILKNETNVFSGRINDLAWDGESKRIMAVGAGRDSYGRAFPFDSGNQIGEVSLFPGQLLNIGERTLGGGECRCY